MKVFALGLDENQKAELAAADEKKETKIPIDSVAASIPTQQPQIVIAKTPNRPFGFTCGILSWFIGAFCLVLLCLAISEVAYHRQRDQAFLRLKWAEIRQRMLGYELLSQQQEIDRMALEKQSQTIEALPLRRSNDPIKPQIMDSIEPVQETKPEVKDTESQDIPSDSSSADDSAYQLEQTAKFGFLKSLIDKIRKHAESMGLNGDMQVHVVEVKPIEMSSEKDSEELTSSPSFNRAISDAFGEIAVPHQDFGAFNDDYDNGRRTFDRHSMKKPFFGPLNRWDNSYYGDYEDQPQNQHFDSDYRNTNQMLAQLYGIFPPNRDMMAEPRFPLEQPPIFWNMNPQQQNLWQNQPVEVQTNQWNQPPMVSQNPFIFYPQQFAQQPQQQFAYNQNLDNNNNDARPWYMPYNEPQDARNVQWQNDDWMQKPADQMMPFQPNPAASAQWVDQTANAQPTHQVDDRTNMFADSNVEPQSTVIAVDKDTDNTFNVKAWMQPQNDQQTENVIAPDTQLESIDENKFLPIRSDDKPIDINDSPVDAQSHLFQIDDPSSFRR